MYLFQGGRMAFGASNLVLRGHMTREMPRYQYQALRWKKKGIVKGSIWFTLMMQKEIFMQALANMGPLSIPGAILVCNKLGKDAPLETTEIVGVVLWFLSYYVEHSSDMQKISFLQRMKKQGIQKASMTEKFWSLSRHPNYLGEWMVWISLSILAIPSLRSLQVSSKEPQENNNIIIFVQQVLLPLSLATCSMSMYYCLTWWTGAVPAEYYSLAKRKGYAEYMKRVPMLIPNVGDVLTYFFGAGK
jgi:steroid 5-alpha reductase family enzyme